MELRKFLKEINSELTKLIERKGGSFFVVEKAKTFNTKPIDIQIKILKRDIYNSSKMLKLRKAEYLQLKERFEKVSTPGFKLQLQTEIRKLKSVIKQTKILKRQSDNQQRTLTGNLNHIEQVGKPNSLVKLHDLEYEIAVFEEKNQKLEQANEKFDQVLD